MSAKTANKQISWAADNLGHDLAVAKSLKLVVLLNDPKYVGNFNKDNIEKFYKEMRSVKDNVDSFMKVYNELNELITTTDKEKLLALVGGSQ